MGKEFVRLSAELAGDFDLSSGLSSSSQGVTSINFYGPEDSHTDITNSFKSLNAIASNSTKYTIINIPSSAPSVTTDSTAPDNPQDGDLWFDESVGKLYVYIDTFGWVQANGASRGPVN